MPQGPLGERIPFEGVLNCWNDDHDLPDLLLSISRSGKTGRLHFSNPEGDKTLDLQGGKIVFAESSSQDDGLGQYLLNACPGYPCILCGQDFSSIPCNDAVFSIDKDRLIKDRCCA